MSITTKLPTDHKAGELAYLDTFAGLVPCKVLQVLEEYDGRTVGGEGRGNLQVRVTAKRGAYRPGEVLTAGGRSVVPRAFVIRYNGSQRIATGYKWAR